MKTNILFICRYNRFRSRVAVAYFRKINWGRKISAKSAGIIKGYPVNKNQIKFAKEFGISIRGSPQGLSSEILKWQDIVIIVADDVPKDLFKLDKKYNKKIIFWNIPDVAGDDSKGVKRVIEKIIKKTNELSEELKK